MLFSKFLFAADNLESWKIYEEKRVDCAKNLDMADAELKVRHLDMADALEDSWYLDMADTGLKSVDILYIYIVLSTPGLRQ